MNEDDAIRELNSARRLSYGEQLARTTRKTPDALALKFEGKQRTFRELDERVTRLANALADRGVSYGDRVATFMMNRLEVVETYRASCRRGAICVPINFRLVPDEVSYIASDSGAKAIVVDSDLAETAGAVRERVSDLRTCLVVGDDVDAAGADAERYEPVLGDASDVAPVIDVPEHDPAFIMYTSGTTGRPKGVMYTHRGAYLSALGNAIEIGMGYETRYLWTLPMFHCNGWTYPWAVTAVAATHVCLRKVEPPRIWELFEEENITHYCAAPTVQIGIVNEDAAHPLEKSVTAAIAGAPPSPTLLGGLIELNIRPMHIYGLTETYGPMTTSGVHPEWEELDMEERARLMARQGQGYCTADLVRVVDDNLQDVERDGETMGEIVMHGNMVAKGYFENEEATEEAFEGGWYHSGDVAVWHPDGYIEIRDRNKDIIISGGENISTIEVEQVVARHPAVMEAAVVAMPDEKWGERPKAFVVLKKDQEATEEEIIDFCKDHIARFKAPAAVEFGELPKTSTGKVQKFVLRDNEWAGQQKRVN